MNNTRPAYDPSQTVYTETSDDQGFLTAHILTNTPSLNPASAKPSLMCYFETYEEMHQRVKASYGEPALYVDRPTFLIEMSKRGMSYTSLEA